MSFPVILLTGATGQVGSYLQEDLKTFGQVVAPSRQELDLTSAAAIRESLRGVRPHYVVHPAAYTAVDKAESDRAACFAINAEATRVLAEEARQMDALLVTFSTDYVFPGTGDAASRESDETGPVNVYGASKLQAEQYLAASGCRYLNLRTSWVYSARGHNFVRTMLKLAGDRDELKVVDDQHGCPSSAAELSRAVMVLLRNATGRDNRSGTYHLCGTGSTTWFEFASCIVDRARQLQPQKSWARVLAVPGTHYPTPARRPANSRLDCTRVAQDFGIVLPPWRESVRQVVETLLTQS